MIFCQVYDAKLMESCVNYQQGDGLSIFAVLNLGEPPRKLASDKKKSYHCHFSLPLPNQIIIFGLGDWGCIPEHSKINVEAWLDTELPPKRIGSLSSDKKCLCWEAKWDKTFLNRSLELYSQDRMAKLTVVIEDDPFSFTDEEKENCQNKLSPPGTWQQTKDTNSSVITPQQKTNNNTGGKLKQQKLSFSLMSKNENTVGSEDASEIKKQASPLSTHPSNLNVAKKKRRTSMESPSLKRQKRPVKDKPVTNTSPITRSSPLSQLLTPPDTPCTPSSSDSPVVPSGRWGHAFTMVDDDRAVVVGGQGTKQVMVKDSLCILNTKTSTWFMKEKESGAERRMGHTITHDPTRHQLYVYGGSKNKRWFSDIHILDTQTWMWSEVKAVGKAPTRAYHTAALFCSELFIFGGNFPNPHPQPDGCSNELYVFDPEKHSWYTPLVTGDIPAARSGHSASLLDEKLVIFGGWDAPKCFNDVHIVDLALMEFTCPKVTGTPPKPRSWHTSTTLPERKVFIHGGFDGVQILGDAFLFELDTLTWTSVQTPPSLSPRVGHASLHLYDNGGKNSEHVKTQIVVFGGGDNRGGYFNDLVTISITTKSL